MTINKSHVVACCTTIRAPANLTFEHAERDTSNLKIDNDGPESDHTHQLSTTREDAWIPPIAIITTVSHSIG